MNFYDKKDQLIKLKFDGDSSITDLDIENAVNLLRFEVQCGRDKLRDIKRKLRFDERIIINYLDLVLSQNIILDYYDKVIGSGDFYNQAKAFEKIDNSDHSTRYKTDLKNTMQLIANARSVFKAKEQFMSGVDLKNTNPPIHIVGKGSTFNNRLKQIRGCGINPILIPRDWEVQSLANLRNEIVEQFKLQITNSD